MKRLIVNADDLGLTEGVSHGILHAHHYGMVTSTSLLANGEAFDMAVALCSKAPRMSVGVHLALTQGKPVLSADQIPTLVDLHGRQPTDAWVLVHRLVTHRVSLREIEIELRAQITRVLAAGITPTHLDGHQHIHVLPGIAEIVIKLAQEFGIRKVRCPIEAIPVAMPPSRGHVDARVGILRQKLVKRVVGWCARRFKVAMRRSQLISPAHFYGLSQTGYLNLETLDAILRYLPKGTSELMCHPGYADPHLARTGTRLLAQREVETRALMSFRPRGLATNFGIELISYGDFAGDISAPDEGARHFEVPEEAWK
jgi:hopanoid biosynthesis associated protein HpnK